MIRYRKDIDGLRAIAVLLVIGFHAFPQWIRGGYVGVDVFFVISGFLISGIIFRKIENGEFDFLEFYSHRVRRIFPALILVLASCLVIGLFVLVADEYAVLGKHVFSAALFASNFLLKSEAGYFDSAAELKPLLHLWSLGVEEQFYIFWPLLLVMGRKLGVRFAPCVTVIGGLSFALNIARVHRFPFEAYYLPHTRIWELLAGSALAYLGLHGPPTQTNRVYTEMRSVAGLGLVAAAVVFLDKSSPFPGYGALLPVIGSYLLISSERAWLNRMVLSNGLFVAIGLMSYPLYLWHWPLFSFLRILGYTSPSRLAAAAALSFLLAWLTHEFLEKPVRRSKQALSLVCLMLLAGLSGAYVYAKAGVLTDRLAKTAAESESLISFRISAGLVGQKNCLPRIELPLECNADVREKPRYLILGDSQSTALFAGLVVSSEPRERWVNVYSSGLLIMEGLKWKYDDLDRGYRSSMQAIVDSDVRLVLMVNALRVLEEDYIPSAIDRDRSTKSRLNGLSDLIERFENSGKQVVLMVPAPWPRLSAVDCAVERPFRKSSPICSITLEAHEKELQKTREMFAVLKEWHPRMLIYDPTPILCPGGIRSILAKGGPLFKDEVHISDFGAELIAKDLLRWLHKKPN